MPILQFSRYDMPQNDDDNDDDREENGRKKKGLFSMRHFSFSGGGRRRRRQQQQQQQQQQQKYGRIILSFLSMLLPSVVVALLLLIHAPIGSTLADTIVIKDNVDDEGTFEYEKAIVSDISRVIDMAWTNDGRVLIAAKEGDIYVFEAGDLLLEDNNNNKKLLYNVDPCTEQERALLSIVVHPKFGTTTTTINGNNGKEYNYLYAYWVHKGRNGNCDIPNDLANVDEDGPYCQLSRFTLTESNKLQNEKVLLRTGNAGKMHNGGGMGFGSDGYLYLATGDTGYSRSDDPANNLDNLWGKILRIKDDGTIPSDNPYVGEKNSQLCGNRILNPGDGKSRVCTEIFAQGLRNPFSLVMNPNTKNRKTEFYVSDVGRGAWEEINVGGTGYEKANYGWREREGPCEMGKTNSDGCGNVDNSKFVDPIHFYQHPSDTGAACVGGAFIPNGIWPQEYDSEYLYSDLRAKSIFHMKRDANNECRGTTCNKQRSKFDSVPIVQDIEGNSVLRLRFGPYNSKKSQDQMSLYHLLYDSGTINRLTYIKKKKNSSDDSDSSSDSSSDDDNQKPTSTIETLYSSDSGGVTVRFDGSKSSDPEGDKLNFLWTFDDNSENDSDYDDGVAATTSHTYQNSGQFTATLKVSDGKGKTSNTATVKINVDTDYDRSSDSDHGVPTLTTFPWSNKCDDYKYDDDDIHIDQCGVLEFCFDNDTKTYGYQIGGHGIEGKCRTLTMGLAPVIRLQPGFTYRMTLRNLAPASTSTNIHTHGLHVVGSGNGDDITRIVKGGGMCMDYTWDIRPDHPGGTYWYHPHAHSRSEIQVNGGATGLLIVEDNVNNNNDIPSWASNELLLQILRLDDGNKMLSNGRSYEIFNIMHGKWYRLRISTVDPLGVAQELRFTAGCEVHKVASDGIWHSVVPFDETSESVNNNTFQMTGSSRGDFALRCNSWESINILFGGKLTAIINIKSGTSSNLRNEVGRWEPKRPSSLQSMDSIDVPNENQLAIKIERDSINGKEWDPDVPLQSLAFNKVYQFDLPDTQRHPFHIHLYHMQVMTPNGCGSGYVEGEFYDTISAGPCTVRFRTSDFGQRLVVHCHVMLHSDLGSMAWFDVKGDGMPLYELTAPYHDCSGNNLPTPTRAPTALYKDGAEKCKVFVELPFTAEAMQFCDYSDTTPTNRGDDEECGTGPVDLKLLEDNSSCGGDCYIAFTLKGEYVTYKFQTDSNVQGSIRIKIRVASLLNKMKKFRLTLLDENLESGDLYTTGKGYKVFEEVVWELSGIPEGLHRLRVDFISDNINLCTISVEMNDAINPTIAPLSPSLAPNCPSNASNNECVPPSNIPIAASFPLPPITWGALDYHEAFEKTAEISFGDGCNIRGDGVDAKRVKDNTCKVRDGSECLVGWWDPGEYLLYRFSIPPGSVRTLDIRVRVATKREGRDIGFELMDIDGINILQSNSFKVPAEGWQKFVDVIWKSVDLEPNDYILKVVSTTGFVNLCSTSITPTKPDLDDEDEEEEYIIFVPGYYSAMYYADTDFYDTTPDRLGNCPYRNDRPVDAKKNKDSICNQAITVIGYDTHCHIAFTDKNEFLIYNFKKEATQNMVQISLRVASKRSNRILVELEGSDMIDGNFVGINKVIQTPGNDAKSFKIYDTIVVWEQVDIGTAEKYKLKLVFLDGRTDLCSIGIEYVSILI